MSDYSDHSVRDDRRALRNKRNRSTRFDDKATKRAMRNYVGKRVNASV